MQSPRFGVTLTRGSCRRAERFAQRRARSRSIGRQLENAARVVRRGRARAPSRACPSNRRRAASLPWISMPPGSSRHRSRAAPSCPRARSARRRRSAGSPIRRSTPGTRSACRRSGARRVDASHRRRRPRSGGAAGSIASTSRPRHRQARARARAVRRRPPPIRAASARLMRMRSMRRQPNCCRKRRSFSKSSRRSLTP